MSITVTDERLKHKPPRYSEVKDIPYASVFMGRLGGDKTECLYIKTYAGATDLQDVPGYLREGFSPVHTYEPVDLEIIVRSKGA